MKKLIFITIICAFVAAPALADLTTITVNDGVGSTLGGEFNATVNGGPIGIYGNGEKISTFCIEMTEYLSLGGTYHVTLNTDAVLGGAGPSDPLDDSSAWVYTQWLDSLAHDSGNADLVQNALWYIEEGSGSANSLVNSAIAAVAGGWTNPDIMVMNLWNDAAHTIYAQDLLVRVPVPGALLLGLLGLSAAGIKLRKHA